MAKAQRRRFSAEYKCRVLREADACRQPGEVSALLRREGLYSSHQAACPGMRCVSLPRWLESVDPILRVDDDPRPHH